MKKVFLLLAPGFELLEATAPIDVLERCGVEVEKVSLGNDLLVPSSHNVFLKADSFLSDEKDVDRIVLQGDMVILPGGFPGYRNLAENSLVGALLKEFEKKGKLVAAICGAPSALAAFSIMTAKKPPVTHQSEISFQNHTPCLLKRPRQTAFLLLDAAPEYALNSPSSAQRLWLAMLSSPRLKEKWKSADSYKDSLLTTGLL